jgi:hypothetical protein
MLDKSNHDVYGHLIIKNKITNEVILDKFNAIHFGNLNAAFAKSIAGYSDGFISYMMFGNGGTVISGTEIAYKAPLVSDIENVNEQMYSPTFLQKVSNGATTIDEYDNLNFVSVPVGQGLNAYKDVVTTVTLQYGDNGPTGQDLLNDAGQIGDLFVFNEISLYCGPKSALAGSKTNDPILIQDFTSRVDTAMLTHVIFTPIQKAQNVDLEIIYTIRVQAGVFN